MGFENTLSTRRQWLSATLRGAVLAGIACVWAHLSRRRQSPETACADPRTGCRTCGSLENCSLPRALSVKEFLKEGNDGQNT
ncbi:MAG: hypothetical protein LLF76_06770 [Planctomycetaceae bacterium]|nr:hypothetical protein [Planctomycetaceae bacterium]